MKLKIRLKCWCHVVIVRCVKIVVKFVFIVLDVTLQRLKTWRFSFESILFSAAFYSHWYLNTIFHSLSLFFFIKSSLWLYFLTALHSFFSYWRWWKDKVRKLHENTYQSFNSDVASRTRIQTVSTGYTDYKVTTWDQCQLTWTCSANDTNWRIIWIR